MTDTTRAIGLLEASVSHGDDAKSRYRLAVLLLQEDDGVGEPQLLGRAREHLARAINLRPTHAPSHAALGYAHYLDDNIERALAGFQEARRLDSRDKTVEVFVLKLLAESGRTTEALAAIAAAAPRHGVDVEALRDQLAEAGMPTDPGTLIANGFIHPRNYFRSSLGEEAERILGTFDPARARRQATAERKRCAAHQQELERTFDASRVPEPLRALAPLASRYGVGDDRCRPFLLQRLSRKDRNALVSAVDSHALAIQEWLDGFAEGAMTEEAAAVMYLALGAEEVRDLD
jgi:hypothetical protein